MATRSRIAIELFDGSILSVYCHWDGYPEFNGIKLQEHFNSYESASELIDGGDISCLWTNAGWNNETLTKTGPLYYSSRGENCPPRHDEDLAQFFTDNEEYAYVFRNGRWVCYNMHQFEDDKLPDIVEIPSAALAI